MCFSCLCIFLAFFGCLFLWRRLIRRFTLNFMLVLFLILMVFLITMRMLIIMIRCLFILCIVFMSRLLHRLMCLSMFYVPAAWYRFFVTLTSLS